VRALLPDVQEVEAALFYPSHADGDVCGNSYMMLASPGSTLSKLVDGLEVACANLRNGLALPGIAAGTSYEVTRGKHDNSAGESDDLSVALPVVPGLIVGRKKEIAAQQLGAAMVSFWEEP
jgi:hypothetical protein